MFQEVLTGSFSFLDKFISSLEKSDSWKENLTCTRKWLYNKEKTSSTVRLDIQGRSQAGGGGGGPGVFVCPAP